MIFQTFWQEDVHQASQAEIFPGNLKIESGKPGRIQISRHFVGTQNSHTAVIGHHEKYHISQEVTFSGQSP